MNKSETIKRVSLLEADMTGIITETNRDYISFLDYDTDNETQYRFDGSITNEYIKNRIFVNKKTRHRGFTPEHMIKLLKSAFKDDYKNAVAVLSGIVVASGESEFYEYMEKAIRTNDNIIEFYDYGKYEDLLGMTFERHQVIFINEKIIDDETWKNPRQYEREMSVTLIHEAAHLIMDCNRILKHEEITSPITSDAEEDIEAFADAAYSKMGTFKHFLRHQALSKI